MPDAADIGQVSDRWAGAVILRARELFAPREIPTEHADYLNPLVLAAYLRNAAGLLLSKKQAAQVMRADPSTTGPKYVRIAVDQLGLFAVEASLADKRVQYLIPTPKLREIVEPALKKAADEMRALTRVLSVEHANFSFLLGPMVPMLFGETAEDVKLETMNEAVRLLRNRPEPYHRRAQLLESMQRFDDAIADLSRAIELNPDHAISYAARARIYQTLGEGAKASADLTTLTTLKQSADTKRSNLVARSQGQKRLGKARLQRRSATGPSS